VSDQPSPPSEPAQTPPPPQLSPDGKFFWDGTRWAPVPLSNRIPRLVRRGPGGCLDVIVLLVVLMAVLYLIIHAVTYSKCSVSPNLFEWPSPC
jgi:hypothetical protein